MTMEEFNQPTNKPTEQIKRLDYFIINNMLCDEAVQRYVKIYGTYDIPYGFITFFITKCQSYSVLINDYLDAYFYSFNTGSVAFDTSMQIYAKSKKPFAKLKEISKNSFLLGLKKGKYIEVNRKFFAQSLSYNADDNDKLKAALGCIELIIDKFNETYNIKQLKKEYETYAEQYKKSGKVTTHQASGTVITGTGKQVKAPPKPITTKRVAKLILPKIELPALYPVSSTKSRVDSRYFVYRFVDSARQVELVHRYRIHAIKFTKGFVKKRTDAFKDAAPKNRFADFF